MKKTTPPSLQPREKILFTALKLFAEQGLERTTVRQIAKEAAVNISAISYYFGDKNGLYRATYTEMMSCPLDDNNINNLANMSLESALRVVYNGFIAPLNQSELSRQCLRLHMRELVEPTGLWSETIINEIAPHHQALLEILKKHLGLNEIDDDLHRLAMCIVALGVNLFVDREVIEKICPQIINTEQGLNSTQESLVRFAMGMVEVEAARRKVSLT